ncbi:hypothetical protein CLG96_17995 [Sphingomonas oleivorans]|uniref:DUF3861 domain-containing protein n=1 Tax=Sphingomonas oleivorans TaxID=1735121 RepID=A0A2T5FTN8_9SPHN|nr:DUF3861 domain-containing protein [Sphingomonas oleivorans]PTQ07432.1 hypothetical protein CLG96_17995 [Sphingomonas oleivorans]
MPKGGHSFLITVTPLGDERPAFSFSHVNHDDIIAIAGRVQAGSGLAPDIAAATAIGLKLLSEAMLRERQDPLFDPLRAPIREFTGALKARISASETSA